MFACHICFCNCIHICQSKFKRDLLTLWRYLWCWWQCQHVQQAPLSPLIFLRWSSRLSSPFNSRLIKNMMCKIFIFSISKYIFLIYFNSFLTFFIGRRSCWGPAKEIIFIVVLIFQTTMFFGSPPPNMTKHLHGFGLIFKVIKRFTILKSKCDPHGAGGARLRGIRPENYQNYNLWSIEGEPRLKCEPTQISQLHIFVTQA